MVSRHPQHNTVAKVFPYIAKHQYPECIPRIHPIHTGQIKQMQDTIKKSFSGKNLGYSIVLWMAGLMTIPQGIYEAAQIDGAGERTILFRITLPMIRPVIFTIVILSFLNSFKVFREAYLVAGNYPQENIYLLQHLFNNWFMDLSVDKMAAGAGILVVVAGALTMLLQRSWEKSYDSKFAG